MHLYTDRGQIEVGKRQLTNWWFSSTYFNLSSHILGLLIKSGSLPTWRVFLGRKSHPMMRQRVIQSFSSPDNVKINPSYNMLFTVSVWLRWWQLVFEYNQRNESLLSQPSNVTDWPLDYRWSMLCSIPWLGKWRHDRPTSIWFVNEDLSIKFWGHLFISPSLYVSFTSALTNSLLFRTLPRGSARLRVFVVRKGDKEWPSVNSHHYPFSGYHNSRKRRLL